MASLYETLILTRADIAALMAPQDWLAAVERGFRALGAGQALSPPPLHIPLIQGGLHAKGARLDGARPVAAVKINANVPGNGEQRGLPTIQGAMVLFDATDGRLLAILDSIEVTLRRTAAATALAARYLARRQSSCIAILGCGAQAGPQLDALSAVLPLREVRLWDADTERAGRFADTAAVAGVSTWVAPDLAQAVRGADVVVTCTTARAPFLGLEHGEPGQFIAAVGADSPEKSEIAPGLMARARVVTDVLDQCLAMGDLRHAVGAGVMRATDIHGELAEIVCGARPRRTREDELFVFDSTGTGIQDVASAAVIHERAVRAGAGLGLRLGAA